MGKADKEFQKMKNNPKDVSKDKLVSLLRRYGCSIKEGKGSHFSVYHELIERVLTVPAHKPIKTPYVKDCIAFIEEIIELENDEG